MATEVGEPTFENFEDTAAAAQFVETVQPVVSAAELPDIKLFGRWSCDDVQVSDMSLQVNIDKINQHLYCVYNRGFI